MGEPSAIFFGLSIVIDGIPEPTIDPRLRHLKVSEDFQPHGDLGRQARRRVAYTCGVGEGIKVPGHGRLLVIGVAELLLMLNHRQPRKLTVGPGSEIQIGPAVLRVEEITVSGRRRMKLMAVFPPGVGLKKID